VGIICLVDLISPHASLASDFNLVEARPKHLVGDISKNVLCCNKCCTAEDEICFGAMRFNFSETCTTVHC